MLQALILLTVDTHRAASDLHESQVSEEIWRVLSESWEKDMRDVDSSAVISRISGSPFLIQAETEQNIDFICSA